MSHFLDLSQTTTSPNILENSQVESPSKRPLEDDSSLDSKRVKRPLDDEGQINIFDRHVTMDVKPRNLSIFQEYCSVNIDDLEDPDVLIKIGILLASIIHEIERSSDHKFTDSADVVKENLLYKNYVNANNEDYRGFYRHLCQFVRDSLLNPHRTFFDLYVGHKAVYDISLLSVEDIFGEGSEAINSGETQPDPMENKKEVFQIVNRFCLAFHDKNEFLLKKINLDISEMDDFEVSFQTIEFLDVLRYEVNRTGLITENSIQEFRKSLSYAFFVNEHKEDHIGFYSHLCDFTLSILLNEDVRFYDAYRDYKECRSIILRLLEQQSAPRSLIYYNRKITILPPEIVFFEKAELLNFKNNKFLLFPNVLLELEHIEKLNLSGNQIQTLPEEIRDLKCHKLNLSKNEFDHFPEELVTNPHLQKLDLSENEMIEDLPSDMSKMTKLRRVDLTDCRIGVTVGHQNTKRQLDIMDVDCIGYPNRLAWFKNDTEVSYSRNENTEIKILDLIDTSLYSIKVMMYWITSDRISNALLDAHKRGVDVKVITDSSSPQKQIEKLVNEGVFVKQIKGNGRFHLKEIIFDDLRMQQGSYNLTGAANSQNDESLHFIQNQPEVINHHIENFYKVLGR